MTNWKPFPLVVVAACALSLGAGLVAQEPVAPASGATKQDHIAALKKALADGQARIRQYEWVETTVISLKGEEKARTQKRCYYGADGKVQKVDVGEAPAAAPASASSGGRARGRRGGGNVKEKIVENKKDEMKEYMQKAAALVHQYVPPDPAAIQAAKDAGRVKAEPQAGGPVRIAIAQYLLPGDSLNIDLDPAANRLLGLAVNSYLDKAEDAVTLAVQMGALPDGAIYAAQTTLDAKAKNITVVIRNGEHRPASQ